ILKLPCSDSVLSHPADRDTEEMDSYRGPATLEWWANRSTCLGEFRVHVAVCVVGSNWACRASLGPERLSNDHRKVFDLLMDLDPVFTLRFDESSEILVNVLRGGDGEQFVLTAYSPMESAA